VPQQAVRLIAAAAAAVCLQAAGAHVGAQSKSAPLAGAAPKAWTVSRTADGHPDLQGIWDYRTLTPLERPAQFAGKEFLTDEEITDYERRAAARPDGRPPDDARSDPSVHPVEWLDYGKRVVGSRRSSLIVDPPDGRIPAPSAEGRERQAAVRTAARGRGPADNPEDRSLWERCVTRGVPEGMLPAAYNNNLQIIQTREYVLLISEMIHDARVVPLDGRPHAPAALRFWTGDPRGHWDGDTLVVDTTNFSEKSNFRGSRGGLHLVERFRRIDEQTLDYSFTVEDPSTWTRPWTVQFPMAKSTGDIYEYGCHEGNYGLQNILKAARVLDRKPD
jgi:hypothetical protein